MTTTVAPLSRGFFLVSIFGFLFSIMFLKQYSMTWAFVVGFFSVIMFIASMISTTKGPVEEELLLDEPPEQRKGRVRIEYPARKKRSSSKEVSELCNYKK